jgi:hypothetical protein
MNFIRNFEKLLDSLSDSTLEKYDSAGNKIKVKFSAESGASMEEIYVLENKLNIKLPETFRTFLNNHNGAVLYNYENLDGFKIYGTNELIEANNFAKNTFEEDWDNDNIIFAKYIGESNYIAFKVSKEKFEYPVIDCYFEELPDSWKIIDVNFANFLDALIENNGKKYWLHQ